jgi:hypothetical protein
MKKLLMILCVPIFSNAIDCKQIINDQYTSYIKWTNDRLHYNYSTKLITSVAPKTYLSCVKSNINIVHNLANSIDDQDCSMAASDIYYYTHYVGIGNPAPKLLAPYDGKYRNLLNKWRSCIAINPKYGIMPGDMYDGYR